MGKTKCQLRRRIGEQLGDVKQGRETQLARHVNEYHGGDPKTLTFSVIEVVSPSERGGGIGIESYYRKRWNESID